MTLSSAAPNKGLVGYDFTPGRVLARKYQVVSRVDAGRSGELYMLNECATGIERTAKFFYPHQNPARMATFYAQKLHRLRHCDILMQYRTQETISVGGTDVTFLVSESVRGEPLQAFLARQPGGRLTVFEGLHLLHALALGVEKMHALHEHHGELAMENVLVRRRGLGFSVKLIDLGPGQGRKPSALRADVFDLLDMFHTAIGEGRRPQRLDPAMSRMLQNLRRPQTLAGFAEAGALRRHLESMDWT